MAQNMVIYEYNIYCLELSVYACVFSWIINL